MAALAPSPTYKNTGADLRLIAPGGGVRRGPQGAGGQRTNDPPFLQYRSAGPPAKSAVQTPRPPEGRAPMIFNVSNEASLRRLGPGVP